MRRTRDDAGVRSVFKLTAPAFEALEAEHDDDCAGWGAQLLSAVFDDEGELVERESYGRVLEVEVDGAQLEVSLGFRGPDWLGFVNSHRALPGDARAVLEAVDRRLRGVEGVDGVAWSDLESFTLDREAWHERPCE